MRREGGKVPEVEKSMHSTFRKTKMKRKVIQGRGGKGIEVVGGGKAWSLRGTLRLNGRKKGMQLSKRTRNDFVISESLIRIKGKGKDV